RAVRREFRVSVWRVRGSVFFRLACEPWNVLNRVGWSFPNVLHRTSNVGSLRTHACVHPTARVPPAPVHPTAAGAPALWRAARLPAAGAGLGAKTAHLLKVPRGGGWRAR